MPFATRHQGAEHHPEDFVLPYVRDLGNVVDMEVIRERRAQLGVDPWRRAGRILGADHAIYGLEITIVNPVIDPTFSFMTVDHDGKIRMDCSSPYAMARLVG